MSVKINHQHAPDLSLGSPNESQTGPGRLGKYFWGSLGLVGVGIVASTVLALQLDTPVYQLNDGIGLFALFFIMAQALERLLEPLTQMFPEKPDEEALQKDPAKRKELAIMERERALVLWAVASFLAMLSSAYLGVFMLRTIGATAVPLWLDVTITGLAIGAGTKPLHDLIKKIETTKQSGG